jgi:hypothetical protein
MFQENAGKLHFPSLIFEVTYTTRSILYVGVAKIGSRLMYQYQTDGLLNTFLGNYTSYHLLEFEYLENVA